jgi:hypothetical protein
MNSSTSHIYVRLTICRTSNNSGLGPFKAASSVPFSAIPCSPSTFPNTTIPTTKIQKITWRWQEPSGWTDNGSNNLRCLSVHHWSFAFPMSDDEWHFRIESEDSMFWNHTLQTLEQFDN